MLIKTSKPGPLFSLLPESIRHRLIRQKVRVQDRLPHGFAFKLAETEEEMEQVFSLMYQFSNRNHGYPQKTSGKRIEKYFMLPTTTTLIASLSGRVVGSIAIVRDSDMGLPADRLTSLQDLRRPGAAIAQACYFAVDEDFRQDPSEVVFPLMKYMWEFLSRYMLIETLIVAVPADEKDFYEAVFGFDSFQEGRLFTDPENTTYEQVLLTLDIQALPLRLESRFGGRPIHQNLSEYFQRTVLGGFVFPDRRFTRILDPVMTPTMLQKFFQKTEDIFSTLMPKEVDLLHGVYGGQEYLAVLPAASLNLKKRDLRMASRLPGRIVGKSQDIFILDASEKGCRLLGEETVSGEMLKIKVRVSQASEADLLCQVAWTNPAEKLSGLKVVSSSALWNDYVKDVRGGTFR